VKLSLPLKLGSGTYTNEPLENSVTVPWLGCATGVVSTVGAAPPSTSLALASRPGAATASGASSAASKARLAAAGASLTAAEEEKCGIVG
jgi:hypothetical protein